MQSSDLAGRGFTNWRPFALDTEKDLLSQLPTCYGVYSIRFPRAESRLRGESDVAYIGKATNRNGLRGRIRQYFHPGWLQSTNLAMKDRLVRRIALECACVGTDDVDNAMDLESELLLSFEAEHGERPPYNKQTALAHLFRSQPGE
jgi:hypothetical protein